MGAGVDIAQGLESKDVSQGNLAASVALLDE